MTCADPNKNCKEPIRESHKVEHHDKKHKWAKFWDTRDFEPRNEMRGKIYISCLNSGTAVVINYICTSGIISN